VGFFILIEANLYKWVCSTLRNTVTEKKNHFAGKFNSYKEMASDTLKRTYFNSLCSIYNFQAYLLESPTTIDHEAILINLIIVHVLII